jgi:HK97 family phage prohead protease
VAQVPRALPDLTRRTVTLSTERRAIDLPTDGAGHLRRGVNQAPEMIRATGDGTDANDTSGVVGFKGDFIPFGQRQWIGSKRWGFWEVNAPACCTKTINDKRAVNNDITFNRDHDNRLLMARTSNQTLRLSTGDKYGHAEADMGDYSYARDVVVGLERGDLTGMSYAFAMIDYEWSIAEDGNDLLTHHEIELYDVAVVGMPANVDTSASLRMDILQAARASGFDATSIETLAVRLADPDPDLIATLRMLSRDLKTVAPDGIHATAADQVAETVTNPNASRTLRTHHDLIGAKIR